MGEGLRLKTERRLPEYKLILHEQRTASPHQCSVSIFQEDDLRGREASQAIAGAKPFHTFIGEPESISLHANGQAPVRLQAIHFGAILPTFRKLQDLLQDQRYVLAIGNHLSRILNRF